MIKQLIGRQIGSLDPVRPKLTKPALSLATPRRDGDDA